MEVNAYFALIYREWLTFHFLNTDYVPSIVLGALFVPPHPPQELYYPCPTDEEIEILASSVTQGSRRC